MKLIDILDKVYNRKCKCCNTQHFATMIPPCMLCGHRARPYIVSYKYKLKDFIARMENLTESEKGYIAGLLDGEGSIGLYQDTRRKTNSILTRITILVNKDKKVIDYISGLLGLKIYQAGDYWSIFIGHRAFAKEFLRIISPYLIIKKERAERAIEFIGLRQGRFHHQYNDRELELVQLSKKGNYKMGRAIQ